MHQWYPNFVVENTPNITTRTMFFLASVTPLMETLLVLLVEINWILWIVLGGYWCRQIDDIILQVAKSICWYVTEFLKFSFIQGGTTVLFQRYSVSFYMLAWKFFNSCILRKCCLLFLFFMYSFNCPKKIYMVLIIILKIENQLGFKILKIVSILIILKKE